MLRKLVTQLEFHLYFLALGIVVDFVLEASGVLVFEGFYLLLFLNCRCFEGQLDVWLRDL